MTTSVQHYIFGIGHPAATPTEYSPPLSVQSEQFPTAGVVIMSSDAPLDADGRPDGTIYIQTA